MKILLVDNDSIYLNLLAEVLALHAYIVVKARNGEEALDILWKESVDLVISDISMPKMNGMNLYGTIRKDAQLRRMPFAWNTDYRELRDIVEIEDPTIDFKLDKGMQIPNLLYFLNHLKVSRSENQPAFQGHRGF